MLSHYSIMLAPIRRAPRCKVQWRDRDSALFKLLVGIPAKERAQFLVHLAPYTSHHCAAHFQKPLHFLRCFLFLGVHFVFHRLRSLCIAFLAPMNDMVLAIVPPIAASWHGTTDYRRPRSWIIAASQRYPIAIIGRGTQLCTRSRRRFGLCVSQSQRR